MRWRSSGWPIAGLPLLGPGRLAWGEAAGECEPSKGATEEACNAVVMTLSLWTTARLEGASHTSVLLAFTPRAPAGVCGNTGKTRRASKPHSAAWESPRASQREGWTINVSSISALPWACREKSQPRGPGSRRRERAPRALSTASTHVLQHTRVRRPPAGPPRRGDRASMDSVPEELCLAEAQQLSDNQMWQQQGSTWGRLPWGPSATRWGSEQRESARGPRAGPQAWTC